MSGISIPINVDTSRIAAAIKEIESLGRVMGNLPPLPGMAPQNPQMSSAWQGVQQTMLSSGNKYQSAKQFADMDGPTRRIAQNLQSWQTAAAKARAELKQLGEDIRGLEKASLDPKLKASTRSVMLDEIRQLSERKKEVEREAQRAETRAAGYQRRLPEGWQQQPPQNLPGGQPDQRGNWSGARRLLGYGLAAAGGFSIGSFISQSRSDYRQAIDAEGPLWARGITGSRERAAAAAGLGVVPHEYYALESQLSGMGLSERNGIGNHSLLTAAFAKSQGVDIGDTLKLRESIFAASGNAGAMPTAVLQTIGKATADGFEKSKISMLLGQIEKGTSITAAAMHGAGLSRQQIASDLALAMAGTKLDGTKGVFARSQEFNNLMQNGLQGSGTAPGDLLLFKTMGGFNGKMDLEKIHEMNVMRQGGFTSRPDLLNKIMASLPGNSLAAKAGALESFFPNWNVAGTGSETLVEMYQSGFFSKLSKSTKGMLAELEAQAKGGDQQAAKWLEEVKSNPALNRQAAEATKDAIRIEAGERLSKLFEPIEMGANKLAGALADGQWQKSFSVLGEAASQMGPVAKAMIGAAGLFAAGSALNFAGGALNVLGGVGGAGRLAQLLPTLGGLAFNPVTGGIMLAGAAGAGLGYLGDQADTDTKSRLANKTLEDRYHQLEVAGAQNGPEAKRIKQELQRRGKRPLLYAQHAGTIRAAAQKYNVPESLLAGLLESESSFVNVPEREISLAGGKKSTVAGVAQFQPETAKRYGVNPKDPQSSIFGAGHYLSDLLKQNGGDYRRALAQYKGVKSPDKMYQVEDAISRSRKYDDTTQTTPYNYAIENPKQNWQQTQQTAKLENQTGNTPLLNDAMLQVLQQIATNTAKDNRLPAASIPRGSDR